MNAHLKFNTLEVAVYKNTETISEIIQELTFTMYRDKIRIFFKKNPESFLQKIRVIRKPRFFCHKV